MKARFRGRRNKWIYLKRIFIIFLLIVLSFLITFKLLYNSIRSKIEDKTYLDYLVNDAFSTYNVGDITSLSSTEFLLKYSFGIEKMNNLVEMPTDVIKDEPKEETIKPEDNEQEELPIVYIYNTHQTEGYKSEYQDTVNINNTVYTASHILKEYLEKLGIKTIVEENNITDILNTNGWKYGASYKASRILLEDAYKNNPSLSFFIDLHRDSTGYNATTCEIDGIKYAKILFVVGLENKDYEKNLELAKILNEKIIMYNKNLSRGIMEKKGPGVNGVYNQDFNPNTILMEVGGQYNNIEEVNNTLKIMASIIFSYLKGS